MKNSHIVDKGSYGVLEVLGPTVEFLTSPDEKDATFLIMKGTIPAGGVIPLDTHADPESFYVLSGKLEVLSERGGRLEWLDAKAGDFIEVPSNAKHGFRNRSHEPVVELITTTPKIGRFFREIGKPARPGVPSAKPTPEELEKFARVAEHYGYWNASPAENAAIGITLPV